MKRRKTEISLLSRSVGIVRAGEEVLVKKEEAGKVMADLYEFPYVEAEESLEHFLTKKLGLKPMFLTDLPSLKHSFTRYKVDLYPSLWLVKEKTFVEGYAWIPLKELSHLPFSSGHRRILKAL